MRFHAFARLSLAKAHPFLSGAASSCRRTFALPGAAASVKQLSMKPTCVLLLICFAAAAFVLADCPSDNLPDKARRVPPPRVKISEADRAEPASPTGWTSGSTDAAEP